MGSGSMRSATTSEVDANLGRAHVALHARCGESDRSQQALFPSPDEAPIVVEVFRFYVANGGGMAVARELNQLGLRFRGGKLWTKDFVLRIISETAVIGTYYWGKNDNRTGKARDRQIAIPVEPILEPTLFEAAPRMRAERDSKRSGMHRLEPAAARRAPPVRCVLTRPPLIHPRKFLLP